MNVRILVVLPLLCLLSGSALAAPNWSSVGVDLDAFDVTVSPSGPGLYTYSVVFNGTDYWGGDASKSWMQTFAVYDPSGALDYTDARDFNGWQIKGDGASSTLVEWKGTGGSRIGPGTTGTFTFTVTDHDTGLPASLPHNWMWAAHVGDTNNTGYLTSAPEPASLVLLGCAAGAGAWLRRRGRTT